MFRAVPMMRLKVVVLAQDERAVLNGLGQLGAVHLTRTKPDPDMAPFVPVERPGELARYDRIRGHIQELRESLEIPLLPKEPPPKKHTTAKTNGQHPSSPQSESDTSLRAQETSAALPEEGRTQAPAERDWLWSERESEGPRTLFGEETTQASSTVMTIDRAEDGLKLIEHGSAHLLERRQRLTQRQKELAAVHERLSSYRGIEIPLTRPDQFSFLHFVTGSLPAQNLEILQKKIGDNVVLHPLVQQKGQQMLFAMTTRQGRSAMEETLQQAGFQREMLPVVEGSTVDRLAKEVESEQEQVAAELEEVNGKLKEVVAEYTLPLNEIEEFVNIEYRLLDASRKFPRTKTAILIAGWVPAGDVAALEQRMEEVTGGRYVLQATPPDASEEQVPVLLKHSRLFRPFEMLIAAYGLPDYQELEPTLFVALSYIVMFGMMFGDAGHGIVLVACGLAALLAGRSRTVRDLGVLLLFGGSSSTIFGVVYGSYFGIEAFKKYALWHDPLEGDPMDLMYGAIGIGIVLISIGLILNIINRLRRGDMIGGILDKFGLVGLLFYWGTLILLTKGATLRSMGLTAASTVLFLVIPIVGWCLKEPLEHIVRHRADTGKHEKSTGLIGLIMESCVGAFEAILSYLANTISFVRLAAYAMSHAALLFAAFMLAAEVRGAVGGSVWSLLVIILGNLIAIVLEGVIASVQALRLEYYEFFGKFFSGGGQPFEPFRLDQGNEDSAR